MTGFYHDGNRQLQDRYDTRRLADRLEDRSRVAFSDGDRALIEAADMFFLATVAPDGQPTCSYKGGDPGFVKVLGERTLGFPNYDGNGMYLSMGNLSVSPRVGMLFVDFSAPRRLRVDGVASITPDDALVDQYPEAQFVVRVDATRIYPNCPRYIHRMELVERSRFVPHAEQETPVPDWKRSDWARDVLPKRDQGAG